MNVELIDGYVIVTRHTLCESLSLMDIFRDGFSKVTTASKLKLKYTLVSVRRSNINMCPNEECLVWSYGRTAPFACKIWTSSYSLDSFHLYMLTWIIYIRICKVCQVCNHYERSKADSRNIYYTRL